MNKCLQLFDRTFQEQFRLLLFLDRLYRRPSLTREKIGGQADHNRKPAAHFGFGAVFTMAWKILQWPITLFFLLLTYNLIYYFAPDVRPRKLKWWSLGGITAVVLWLLVSFGFRIYLHFFNSYSVTYGSLGALIVLMLWFYFTGLAILIGGEINSELERGAQGA